MPLVTRDVAAGPPLGLTTNAFLNPAQMLAINPNDGLRVLGDRWHDTKGGVAFGVPVRPCDRDKRGCRDFGGYGDQSLTGLEFPEFNDNLDFIREAYVKNTLDLGDNKSLFLKIGKQQVVWGRTDLFRVLDVINPVDYSRNNIYDELQDIRIPQWIVQAEYRMGVSDLLQERNRASSPWMENHGMGLSFALKSNGNGLGRLRATRSLKTASFYRKGELGW